MGFKTLQRDLEYFKLPRASECFRRTSGDFQRLGKNSESFLGVIRLKESSIEFSLWGSGRDSKGFKCFDGVSGGSKRNAEMLPGLSRDFRRVPNGFKGSSRRSNEFRGTSR